MKARLLPVVLLFLSTGPCRAGIDTILEASGIVGCDSAEASLIITAQLVQGHTRLTECVFPFKTCNYSGTVRN